LLSALAAGHLIKAHMAHNRSPAVASAGTVTGFGTPAVVEKGVVVEKEKECGLVNNSGLTLSPSSASLPPYSR